MSKPGSAQCHGWPCWRRKLKSLGRQHISMAHGVRSCDRHGMTLSMTICTDGAIDRLDSLRTASDSNDNTDNLAQFNRRNDLDARRHDTRVWMLLSRELRCIVRKLPRKRKLHSFVHAVASSTALSGASVRPLLRWCASCPSLLTLHGGSVMVIGGHEAGRNPVRNSCAKGVGLWRGMIFTFARDLEESLGARNFAFHLYIFASLILSS
jgi:hypothetical protein